MERVPNNPFRLIAAASAVGFIGAGVVVLSATIVGERLIALQTANAAVVEPQQQRLSINREAKADKLVVPAAPQARAEIKSVEVIGLSNASIVYRDRGGNILFQTDPLANVTIVTKNVDLPEVTIRESEGAKVERIPVEDTARPVPPHGCESAFAKPSPESLTRTPSRCLTQIKSGTSVAALR